MREPSVLTQPAGGRNSVERRRAHRVCITMPVLIRGQNGLLPFSEETLTASVNAYGCMVRLAAEIIRGQEVAIVNPQTLQELPCTVTFVGQKESGKTETGLAFIEPSPLFWQITVPPGDGDPPER